MPQSNEIDKLWMQRAINLAMQAAEQNEVPVGALVVDENNQLLGEAFNQSITACDPTAHAEIEALRSAAKKTKNYRLVGATVYVTLEPCAMCFGAMVHARIKRLVYAASEPKAGIIRSNLQLPEQSFFNHVIEVSEGVCAEEAGNMLSAFFKMRRDKKKALKENIKAEINKTQN